MILYAKDCEHEIAETCRVAAEQFVSSRRVADQIMTTLSQQERNSPPFACLEEARIKIEQFTSDRDSNINWLHRSLKEAESRRLEMFLNAEGAVHRVEANYSQTGSQSSSTADTGNPCTKEVAIFPEYLEKIFKAFADEVDKMRQELRILKETLLGEKFVNDEECLEALVNELGQTAMGKVKMRAEGSLAYLEIAFGWIVATNQKHFLDPIVKFITELTRLWRTSGCEGLRLQQTDYGKELSAKRAANREKVDQQEIRLGQVIDDLRRADNEAAVEQLLEEALGMLRNIEILREQHHKSVLDFLNQYPAQVAKALLQVHKDICQFFGVHRCAQAEIPPKLQKNLESLPPIFEKYFGFSDPKTPRRRYTSQEITNFTLTPTAVFYTMTEEEIRREVNARERKAYTTGFQPLNRPDSARKKELPLGLLSAGLVADFSDMPRLAWLLPASTKKMQFARMVQTPPVPITNDSASSPIVCSFPTTEDQMYPEALKEFPIIEPTVLHNLVKQFKRNVREAVGSVAGGSMSMAAWQTTSKQNR
ncbi:unnamed protein product [Schistocephalus solidus]|uniref:DUF4455 domain-containing protein n=1 Tax=Schistocephalus solidus TaxID=70667 RepID=A0A183S7E2_SCHSO|nr:unnamed protein product [Schistocephalus solidus]